MKTLLNNLVTEYTDEGKGPIILFLHGWKDTLHTFDTLIPLLSGSFQIIRIDLPGFGGSEAPRKPWGVGEYAHFVKAVIEKFGISVDTLVGHSFGGRIAIKGVGTSLLRPRKLVLIGSAGLMERRGVRNLLFNIVAKIGKIILFPFSNDLKEKLRLKLYKKAGSEDYVNAGTLRETFLRVTAEDLSAPAREIHIPTLLIWGDNDVATPLSDGKRLHELISGSKLEIIAGAGHFVHQERPEAVAKLIKEFASQ